MRKPVMVIFEIMIHKSLLFVLLLFILFTDYRISGGGKAKFVSSRSLNQILPLSWI